MKKVLIIEDERLVFLDLKITFAKAGYEVIYGNKHNIESVCTSDFRPDLVIVDLHTFRKTKGLLKFAFNNVSKFENVPVIISKTGKCIGLKYCLGNKINLIGEVDKPYNSIDVLEFYVNYLSSQRVIEDNGELSGILAC